tara:strand:+ start:1865 stop:2290 length:426 start_codon:yes stop_codon:yes gene_type:complete
MRSEGGMTGESLSWYPIDTWFGKIIDEDGKKKLVSRIGYSTKTGKDGKKYALVGGGYTDPDQRRGSHLTDVIRERDKELTGLPVISAFTDAGWKAAGKRYGYTQPDSHEVIPDNVISRFKEGTAATSEWGILQKWFDILRA